MNRLAERNSHIDGQIRARKKEVDRERVSRGYVKSDEYLLATYRKIFAVVLGEEFFGEELHLSFIDYTKHGADIALRLPGKLKKSGAAVYTTNVVPRLVTLLQHLIGQHGIAGIGAQGIYVNIALGATLLVKSLERVHTLAERFGEGDIHRAFSVVYEFSGPNAAKHLHAGHIHGTIVGEALARINAAVGYTVHRINHINDWGGFGAILEGYDRWHDDIRKSDNKNDELYQVYMRYRELERDGGEAFAEFKVAADALFTKLEAGEDATVQKWSTMVGWSVEDFDAFYRLIGAHFDYSPGESFYVYQGKQIVLDATGNGVIKCTDENARSIIDTIPPQTSEKEREHLTEEIMAKVGAWVVDLGDGKLFVVQRADGGSMYATRDLAAIAYRAQVFTPTAITYVVGHEQTDYLRDLFFAAKKIGLFDPQTTILRHVPIGLYVSKDTGKKLSSREGALGVMELLGVATEHFKRKYDSREYITVGMKQSEIQESAKLLALGSIIFNDLRKEHALAVDFSTDTDVMLTEFEESGGAYVMYARARARSILRKAGIKKDGELPVIDMQSVSLVAIERELIKRLHELPEMVLKAATNNNAAVISNYVLELARTYNSYYASHPVLEGDTVLYPHRLAITSATAQCITNCLNLLNINPPDIL